MQGYSLLQELRPCGKLLPHCDVSLSYHRNGKMVCRGFTADMKPRTPVCPRSSCRTYGRLRAGTQQIEDVCKGAVSAGREFFVWTWTQQDEKDGHEKIFVCICEWRSRCTGRNQMIVKGHDFPNVTLVGVLAADMSLYSDDYRSGERTFPAFDTGGRASRTGAERRRSCDPDLHSHALQYRNRRSTGL